MKTAVLNIRLPPELKERLKVEAQITGKSISQHVINLIRYAQHKLTRKQGKAPYG